MPPRSRRASPVEASAIAGRASPRTAHLTPGHFDLPSVRGAAQIADRAVLTGEFLGQGNFGRAYRVPTDDGPVIVKRPALHTIHGQPWDLAELRTWFIHEAGVANELEEITRVTPRTVYTETSGGKPALVREYGSIVRDLTVDEYDDLASQLAAVVEAGWTVRDDLLIARRPDGSLFIADVGVWFPLPDKHTPDARAMQVRAAWDDLWFQLRRAALHQNLALPGADSNIGALPSQAEIDHLAQEVAEKMRELHAPLDSWIQDPEDADFERELRENRLQDAEDTLREAQELRARILSELRQSPPAESPVERMRETGLSPSASRSGAVMPVQTHRVKAHTPAGRKYIFSKVLRHATEACAEQARDVSSMPGYRPGLDLIVVGPPITSRLRDTALEIFFRSNGVAIRPETVNILTEFVPGEGLADDVVTRVNAIVDHFLRKPPGWGRYIPHDAEEARRVSRAGEGSPWAEAVAKMALPRKGRAGGVVERCPYMPGTDIGVYQRREHQEIGFFLEQVKHEVQELQNPDCADAHDLTQARANFRKFSAELEEHLSSEESTIFPQWERNNPKDRVEIEAFLRDHGLIRMYAERVERQLLGLEPHRREYRYISDDLDTLHTALLAHEAQEERLWPVRGAPPRAPVERLPTRARAPSPPLPRRDPRDDGKDTEAALHRRYAQLGGKRRPADLTPDELDDFIERETGQRGRGQPSLVSDWENTFSARDVVREKADLPTQMSEVAWEIGYEHAQYGNDPYERVLGRFEPLARRYDIDLREKFGKGFQAGGGVEARATEVARTPIPSARGVTTAKEKRWG